MILQIENISSQDLLNHIDRMINRVLEQKGTNQLTNNTNNDLLTSKELLSKLKLSYVTLWRMEKEGKIKPLRIGKKKYYDFREIRESIERR